MDIDALGDDQWERLRGYVPGGTKGKRGPRTDNRRFLDALLWMARSGGRWRDLLERLGDYRSVKPPLLPLDRDGRSGHDAGDVPIKPPRNGHIFDQKRNCNARGRGDSHSGLDVIHALDGSQYSDGRPMGEDGTALSGQAD